MKKRETNQECEKSWSTVNSCIQDKTHSKTSTIFLFNRQTDIYSTFLIVVFKTNLTFIF